MRSGTILLASSYVPSSLLIHNATLSKWNHCGLLLFLDSRNHLSDSTEARPLVAESTFDHGVVVTPLSVFLARYTRVDAVSPLAPLDLSRVAESLRKHEAASFPSFPYVTREPGRVNCAHLVSSVYADLGLMSPVSVPGALAPERLPFPVEHTTILKLRGDYLGAIALPLIIVALIFVMAHSLLNCVP